LLQVTPTELYIIVEIKVLQNQIFNRKVKKNKEVLEDNMVKNNCKILDDMQNANIKLQ
jgi:hypothetical protein